MKDGVSNCFWETFFTSILQCTLVYWILLFVVTVSRYWEAIYSSAKKDDSFGNVIVGIAVLPWQVFTMELGIVDLPRQRDMVAFGMCRFTWQYVAVVRRLSHIPCTEEEEEEGCLRNCAVVVSTGIILRHKSSTCPSRCDGTRQGPVAKTRYDAHMREVFGIWYYPCVWWWRLSLVPHSPLPSW